MASAALFVLPEYSGVRWEPLPNLYRGVEELAALLTAQADEVSWATIPSLHELTRFLAEKVNQGGAPLLVYIGGHGFVWRRHHYTALDATPSMQSSSHALESRSLAETLAGRGRDVLVVLDSCFSGEGAVSMISEAVSVLADLPRQMAFGVVASCRAFEPAEDGLFVEKLLELVRGGPMQDIHAWGPGDDRIRIGALAAELIHAGFELAGYGNLGAFELRLIPNPRWNRNEPEDRVDVKSALRRLSRDAASHLMDKSGGFVGREGIRGEVVTWLASRPRGTLVITGGPGTGKSALIGLLARQSVGDPTAASPTGGPALPEGTFDVIVYARQKTVDAVRAELSALVGRAGPVTVLVDALDEAVAGEAPRIADHLASLVRNARATIIVGTRRGPAVGRGAAEADALVQRLDPELLLDLDSDEESTRVDIARMLRIQLVGDDSPYRRADVPIDEIVTILAAATAPSFLFAQATGRWMTSQGEPLTDLAGWRDRLRHLAREANVGRLVEEDLAARFPDDLERVRDLLRAAAWTEGLGIPRYVVWPSFANELALGAGYSDADLTWLLSEAGWYLTESSEDGQTVYRLFHQALTDHFRADTTDGDQTVQDRLTSRLRAAAMSAGGWLRAEPYVLHYLVAHAEQGSDAADSPNSFSALLEDPEFVAHADAGRLATAMWQRPGREGGPLRVLLQRCVQLLDGRAPAPRLALLRLTALQQELEDPITSAPVDTPWWPIWARWRSSVRPATIGGGGMLSVASSPASAMLVSARGDGTLSLWNSVTGEEERTIAGHFERAWDVAFSPDGLLVASAGEDWSVRLWDVATGEAKQKLMGHQHAVWAVAFSPDGAAVASAGEDSTVRLWDIAKGDLTRTLGGHEDGVRSVAFSPDGAMLASAAGDGTVKFWDAASGELRRTLVGHADGAWSVAFSPDGATVASGGGDGAIKLWDAGGVVAKPPLVGHASASRVWSVAFSLDGTTLASAGADQTVRLWDTAAGASVGQVFAGSVCLGVAWSAERRLAIVANDGIAVIDVAGPSRI